MAASACGETRAGSVISLVICSSGEDLLCGGDFGSFRCGSLVPYDGSIDVVSDSEAVFTAPGLRSGSGSAILPVQVTGRFRLAGGGLEMDFGLTGADPAVDVTMPLEVEFSIPGRGRAVFSNQAGDDWDVTLNGTHGVLRISTDQLVDLFPEGHGQPVSFVFPDPSRSILVLSDLPGGYHPMFLRLLDTEPPRGGASGPFLHSRIDGGFRDSVHVQCTILGRIPALFLSAHPMGLECSASWMIDDIPFRHPPDTTVWAYSTSALGGEYVSAWLIALLEAHPSLRMDWLILADAIFGVNCDSMSPEPGMEGSWSHWHGPWRIATRSPLDYRAWLAAIQDGEYPWAGQVRLGCHGYHHTASPDSAWDPFSEFIQYDPEEHDERFSVIESDWALIGLDVEGMRALRFPGLQTSQSGLQAAATAGIVIYCNGSRWSETMGGQVYKDQYLSRYAFPGAVIWGTNSCWWADYSWQMSTTFLTTVLDRGKHALIGCHPGAMWGDGDRRAWARMDSICASLEARRHFAWIFPEDYGEFLEETSRISFESVRLAPDGFRADFSGQATSGQTFVALLPEGSFPEAVMLDGAPIPWDERDRRVFAVLPQLEGGSHSIEFDIGFPSIQVPDFPAAPCGEDQGAASGGSSLRASAWTLLVFDMAGRLVKREPVTESDGWLPGQVVEGCPEGIYAFALVSPSGSVLSAGTASSVPCGP